MASLAATADEAKTDPTSVAAAGPVAEPSANAKVIEVGGRPTVEHMKGDCRLIREPAPSPALKTGLWLKSGDVLDLGTDCAMTIGVTGHKRDPLSLAGGRFYRLSRLHASD
jgi:hypothetical protein